MIVFPVFANASWWNPIDWFSVISDFFHPQTVDNTISLPATTTTSITEDATITPPISDVIVKKTVNSTTKILTKKDQSAPVKNKIVIQQPVQINQQTQIKTVAITTPTVPPITYKLPNGATLDDKGNILTQGIGGYNTKIYQKQENNNENIAIINNEILQLQPKIDDCSNININYKPVGGNALLEQQSQEYACTQVSDLLASDQGQLNSLKAQNAQIVQDSVIPGTLTSCSISDLNTSLNHKTINCTSPTVSMSCTFEIPAIPTGIIDCTQ